MQNKHAWYTLKVMPSQEMRILDDLTQIMKSEDLKDLISDVAVVTQYKKLKNGTYKKAIHDDFKSFVFVKMILNDTTYNAVKISGVRHILGSDQPVPMTDEEAEHLFSLSESTPPEE